MNFRAYEAHNAAAIVNKKAEKRPKKRAVRRNKQEFNNFQRCIRFNSNPMASSL